MAAVEEMERVRDLILVVPVNLSPCPKPGCAICRNNLPALGPDEPVWCSFCKYPRCVAAAH